MAFLKVMPGLQPKAAVCSDHNWADVKQAKGLVKAKLMLWLERSALMVANRGKQEAPGSTGAGRSWINSVADPDELSAYAGIISGPGTKGGVPSYMGMIEKGITPHKVSLKHRGIRKWFARTFKEPEAKPSSRGFYRSVMVWKSTGTFNGIRRERIGGKVAIPWLGRAVKHELPNIRAELRKIAGMA